MGTVDPGQSFGVLATLDGGPDTLDAVAAGTTEIVSVPRAELLELLERSPEARRTIALEICRRSWVITSLIANLSASRTPAHGCSGAC